MCHKSVDFELVCNPTLKLSENKNGVRSEAEIQAMHIAKSVLECINPSMPVKKRTRHHGPESNCCEKSKKRSGRCSSTLKIIHANPLLLTKPQHTNCFALRSPPGQQARDSTSERGEKRRKKCASPGSRGFSQWFSFLSETRA